MIFRPHWTPGVPQCNWGYNTDHNTSQNTRFQRGGEEEGKARKPTQKTSLLPSLSQLFLCLCSPLTSSCRPKVTAGLLPPVPQSSWCSGFPEVATFALTLLVLQPSQPFHVRAADTVTVSPSSTQSLGHAGGSSSGLQWALCDPTHPCELILELGNLHDVFSLLCYPAHTPCSAVIPASEVVQHNKPLYARP